MKKDDMYKKAKALVLKRGNFSPSYLQRKLEIGYNSALELIEQIKKDISHLV